MRFRLSHPDHSPEEPNAYGKPIAYGHWEGERFVLDRLVAPTSVIRERLRGMSVAELLDFFQRRIENESVIDGVAIRIEDRPERLLDAGGSES